MYHGKRGTPIVSPWRREQPFTKKGKGGYREKRALIGLVERGGEASAVHIEERVTAANVRSVVVSLADRKRRLYTDKICLQMATGYEFGQHETVNHDAKEYARGDATTNGVESFFSLVKRGKTGVYHHCGEQHLQRQINEFAFR